MFSSLSIKWILLFTVVGTWCGVVDGACSGTLSWQCRIKDECISALDVCDGVPQCSDGSDEIFSTCANNTCPGFAFRCGYGACVSGDATCDGINDCADNSDEQLPTCNGVVSRPQANNCKDLEFACLDGRQCIAMHELCDGSPQCQDKSDETLTQCSSLRCPGYAFKCAYGACVDGDAACNGQAECADASDEYAPQCNKTGPPPQRDTTDIDVHIGPAGKCIAPVTLVNGDYSLENCENCRDIQPGSEVPQGARIVYHCNAGYRLLGVEQKTCTRSGWSSPHIPVCSDYCEPLTSSRMSIQCFAFNYTSIPCNKAMPAGSIVRFKCRTGIYDQVRDVAYDRLTCTNGAWNRPLPEKICDPACGVAVLAFAQPFIKNGVPVEQNAVPWHAGIYTYVNDTESFELECGGSLITQNIVLSAAHCFKEAVKNPADPSERVRDRNFSLMRIALGKLLRKLFSKTKDINEQVFEIKRVMVPVEYEGESNRYSSDIAVVFLNRPVVFTVSVLPVCLDIGQANREEDQLLSGAPGKVVGWGNTGTSTYSEKLLMTNMPYVPRDICLRSSVLEPYVTFDKICAGDPSTSSTVCPGDSGGGLVFFDSRTRRYTLRGIVSLGNKGCEGDDFALFTRVSKFSSFIDSFLT